MCYTTSISRKGRLMTFGRKVNVFFRYWPLAIAVLLGPVFLVHAQQQKLAEINGLVTDALNGLPLHGATIALSQTGIPGIINGTATDDEGRFRVTRVRPGRYTVTVRFVGYVEEQRTILLNPAQSLRVDVSLEQSSIDLNTVVVSASRQQEKILEAISSISVVNDREIHSDVTPSSASTLRNVMGIDIAQTGVDRRELALRGFNNSVTGVTYVLTDHRLSSVPGLAINAYGLMPITTLDLNRIEIVRGPGAALYGAGVDQGLLHFVTKDPFAYPGTSISTGGGERGLLDVEFRHAGVYNGDLGYKIVGEYVRGEDWSLDPDDPVDRTLINAEGGLRDPDYWRYGVSGMAEYRIDDDVSLTGNGGFLSQKMALLTGIGAAQTNNFSYVYGQVRLDAGPFFAQAYLNQNNSGQSFYYGPTALLDSPFDIQDRTLLVNGQVQYNETLLDGRELILAGVDYKLTLPRTAGTLHGRNESNDHIEEFGAYLQSSTVITEDVDLTAALRADYNNIAQKIQLSPRAGIVFKITPRHTFRVTGNRAFGAPGLNPNFLDLRIANHFTSEPFALTLQGRGAHEGFTFDAFREQGTVAYLLPDAGDTANPDSPVLFGRMVPQDQIPLAPIYEAFAAAFGDALLTGADLPAAIGQLSAGDRSALSRFVEQLAPFVQGSGTGVLGVPALTESGFRRVGAPIDIAPLEQTVTSSIEVGYKGVFANRFIFTADAYLSHKKNFVGPLLVEAPFVYLENLDQDLRSRLLPVVDEFIQADPDLADLLGRLGLGADETAAYIASLAAGGFGDTKGFAEVPVAVVQPDQNPLPETSSSTSVGGLLSYRNYGDINLWGVDLSLEYLASDQLRVFSSASFVSDDYFDNTELEEENTDLAVSLNAPKMKVSGGFEYRFPRGFSFRAAGRFVEEFPVISGPYVGLVEDYFVIDAGLGYDFGRQVTGLRVDLTAQNLMTVVNGEITSMHREFIGAPKVGRIVMARVVYTF